VVAECSIIAGWINCNGVEVLPTTAHMTYIIPELTTIITPLHDFPGTLLTNLER